MEQKTDKETYNKMDLLRPYSRDRCKMLLEYIEMADHSEKSVMALQRR